MITSNSVDAANEIKDYSFIKNSGDNKWYEEVFGTWYSSNDKSEYIFFQIGFPWINYYGQGNCSGSVALLDNKIHFKFGNGYIGPYKYFTYQDHKMLALYPDDTVVEFIRDEKNFPIEKRKMLLKQLKLSEIDVVISGPNNYKLSINYKADNPNSVIKDGTVTVKTENTPYPDQELNFKKLNATYLLDLIVENDVSEWEKLPQRENITADEYQADVMVKFTNKEFKFSSKQKLPTNTKALVFQRLYTTMLSPSGSKFNPYFEHTIGEPEDVQYVYIRNKKIPIINGTGSTNGDFAIVNYGEKIWWIEEEITGEYEFLRNNDAFGYAGVKDAHMTIREDGTVSVTIDGEQHNSKLSKYRKYHSAIQAGIGTFYFTNEDYTEILYNIPGQPHPVLKSPISFYMKKIK